MNARLTRRYLGGVGVGAIPAALAACGPLGGQPGGSPGAASKQPVTVVWSPWDGEGQAIVDGANKGT